MKITPDKNFYLTRAYRYMSETSPQYETFIDASRENTDYTLRKIF